MVQIKPVNLDRPETAVATGVVQILDFIDRSAKYSTAAEVRFGYSVWSSQLVHGLGDERLQGADLTFRKGRVKLAELDDPVGESDEDRVLGFHVKSVAGQDRVK